MRPFLWHAAANGLGTLGAALVIYLAALAAGIVEANGREVALALVGVSGAVSGVLFYQWTARD